MTQFDQMLLSPSALEEALPLLSLYTEETLLTLCLISADEISLQWQCYISSIV